MATVHADLDARAPDALKREVQRVEAVMADLSARAADAAVLAELGVSLSWSPDEGATESRRMDEVSRHLDQLMGAAQEDRRRREMLAAEERELEERERAVTERIRGAHAALERARAHQPLLDLCALVCT
jgi:hypothetical protein